MAMTTNGRRPDRHRDEVPPAANRRELVEGLILLAVLVILALVARLPAG